MKSFNLKSLWTKLKTLAPRKVILYSLILVLLVASFFVFKNNIFKADTTNRTITVSGNFTDSISLKPVVGATISLQYTPEVKPIQVKTDNSGNFSALVVIDKTDWDYIQVYASAEGYRDEERLAWIYARSDYIKNVDFKYSKIPIDVVSTKVLDSVSSRCRTSYNPDSYSDYYHPGDYVGNIVEGVLFCAAEQNKSIFVPYDRTIMGAAIQINKLVKRTNLSYTPTVYLTGDITWISDAAAYVPWGQKEIIVNIRFLDKELITHEFGHLVDWERGIDITNPFMSTIRCSSNNNGTKQHCSYSSQSLSFTIGSLKPIISGYALTNEAELFAEFFSAQQQPDDSSDASEFSRRERLRYNILNVFSYADSSVVTDRTSIRLDPALSVNHKEVQNMAMFVYKAVASAGNIDQYFPGILNIDMRRTDIKNGLFMNKAILAMQIDDENSNPIKDVQIDIGGATSGKSFYDGLLVLTNIPAGKQIITVKLPSGAIYNSDPIDFQVGANGVIYLKISTLSKVTLRPTSDAFNPDKNAVPSAGPDLFTMVKEVTPDDNTTYISPAGTFANVMFGHGAHNIPADMIVTGVKVYAKVSGISTIPTTNLLGIYNNNQVYFGDASESNQSISGDWTVLSQNFPVCPFKVNKPWTFADLDAMAFGGVFGNSVKGAKMTQIYAEVSYGRLDITRPTKPFPDRPIVGSTAPNFDGNFIALGGIIEVDGSSITRRGIEYWQSGSTKKYVYEDGNFGAGEFEEKISLTEFQPDVQYNFRAYAVDSYGTINSITSDFINSVPKVETVKIDLGSGTTTNIVKPQGNIISRGDFGYVTKRGFQVTRAKDTVQADYGDTGSFGVGEFSKANVNLAVPNSTYYVRAYATNSTGTGYGDWVEFKSSSSISAPQVATLPVTSIGTNLASFRGNTTSVGGSSVTKRGFQVTRDKTKIQADYPETGSFGVGEFTKTNVSLYFANSTYYVRAYATNSIGTAHGDWVEFKTLAK